MSKTHNIKLLHSFQGFRWFFVSIFVVMLFGGAVQAQSLHPMESRLRREFPTVALGSPATTFEPAEAMTSGRMVSGLRARFAMSVPKTAGLSPVDAAMAQMAARDSAAAGLRVLYPRFFNDEIVAEAGGQRVVLRPIGARSAAAQPANGKIIYEGTYDSVDTIEVPDSNRSEELLLLRDDRAPLVFDYEIVEMTGVAGVVMHDGAIRFMAPAPAGSASQVASGKWEASPASLEIERPWVVDASGNRPESAAVWTLGEGAGPRTIRLTVRHDLTYPLVVDPSFSTTGSLGTARYQHTATLLPNGKVLIAGGAGNAGNPTSAELYDPAVGTFSPTGPLGAARYQHTATLLPNGKVLIAGGYNGSDLNSAELYDPAVGTFSPTGPLVTPRFAHTATLLPNGKVLIAGGANGAGRPTSAELYDPALGTFSATGPLGTGRWFHTATLLPNGKVLIAGGQDLTSAELYDPALGTFSATGPLGTARFQHTATLLPNGKVLIACGDNGAGNLASAELYDPGLGTFSSTGALATARRFSTATLLPNGKVLIAGGDNGSNLTSAELYDPAAGTFSATGPLGTGRWVHTATLLPNGKVLIAGGYNGSSLASAELYDPAAGTNGTFTAVAPMTGARMFHTATLLPNGKVLIAGGSNGSANLASAELYDSAAGTFTAVAVPMTASRYQHTATLLPNGKVLLAGGANSSGALASAELYDPAAGTNGTFTAVAVPMTGVRQLHTATLLPNGKVLLAGGQNSSGVLASAELYDPAAGTNGTFTAVAPMTGARMFHTATLLPNGKVLIAGGGDSSQLHASAELYDPAAGTNGTFTAVAGTMTTVRRIHTATLLPNGNVLIAGGQGGGFVPLASAELYDPAAGTNGTFTALAVPMTAARYQHTATLLPSGKVLLAGGSNGPTLNSAELYDTGLGFADSRRPLISSAPSTLTQPASLALTGTGFRGDSEASSGSTSSSATNYPLLQLQRIDNDQTLFVPASAPWTDTSFTSITLSGLAAGYYRATIVTNGIPSMESLISFLPPKSNQTISFTSTAPAAAKVAGATYTVTATATSGLTVTFTIDATATSVCSISGSTVSFIGAGTCVIDANQTGNTNYNAAPQVQQSFAVGKGSQTVTFTSTAPIGASVGGATYNVTATASSGLTPALTIDAAASSVCSIAGSTVSFIGAGTCVIDGNQAGDTNYNAAPQVQQSFAVGKGSQTVTFTSTAPVGASVGGATYNVTATASSGLTPALTIDASASSVCTISGSTVSFIGSGTCVIDGNQAGSSNYNAATQAQQSFAVGKGSQTVTFTSTAPAGASVGGATYNVTATASSGLTPALTIDASATSVCSISGSTVSFIGAGSCVIDGNQAGNTNYNAAIQAQQSFTVTLPAVTVTSVTPAGGTIAGGSAVTINGTGFINGAGVTFGGSAATNVVVVSAIKITARTPAHALGAVNVTVTNTNTSTGTLTSGYLYKAQQFDPNSDGTITALDIFYLVNYLYMGGPAPMGAAGVLSGDTNGDGVVNPLDIFYLVNYLFLGGPRPNAIPNAPQVTAMAIGTDAPQLSGSIELGKAVLRNGHYFVPVIMTAGPGSASPQAMSLRVHFDGEVGNATIRKAGAAKDLAVAFETDRFAGNDLSYLVSYGNLFLGASSSAVVAEIEIETSSALLSIDPHLTMLSNQAGTMTASVANGKLKVTGTKIGNGSTPQPRTPDHKVN